MSLFSRVTSKGFTKGAEPQADICRGDRAGDIGLWVVWNPKTHPIEVLRVTVSTETKESAFLVKPYTYSFLPSHEEPFLQSLEANYELREFLRGKNRAHTGNVTFEIFLSDGKQITFSRDVEVVFSCMRKVGPKPHPEARVHRPPLFPDSYEVSQIPREKLKAESDAARKAIAEKQRIAEEARKKAEADKAEAAHKAAEAQKAAADKAAGKAAGAPASGPSITGGKSALIYGSTTGNTTSIAEMIKSEMCASLDHVKNITDIVPQDLVACPVIIIGIPTWHIGELQDDWASFMPELKKLDFKGKKIAFFGLGDGKGYPDTYVDAMQEIWEVMEKSGATLHGQWPTEGYEFQKSKAIKNGKFLGLVIDVENQHNLSEGRVKAWVAQLKKELSL